MKPLHIFSSHKKALSNPNKMFRSSKTHFFALVGLAVSAGGGRIPCELSSKSVDCLRRVRVRGGEKMNDLTS